jgi:hypothetical protein
VDYCACTPLACPEGCECVDGECVVDTCVCVYEYYRLGPNFQCADGYEKFLNNPEDPGEGDGGCRKQQGSCSSDCPAFSETALDPDSGNPVGLVIGSCVCYGACCGPAPGECSDNSTQSECDAISGTFHLGQTCADDPCAGNPIP